MLYGLFIKMCIADNLAPIVNQIFEQYEAASQIQLLLGAIGFGLQIYADFHGYSLIAIGSAQLFGIKLMDNFNAPYTATSIREFWNKWHISLSTWFRDYLYIPLGGNQAGVTRLYVNILIVFVVSGVWHGANLTFIIWGAMHGFAYLLEKQFSGKTTMSWLTFPKWLTTMSIVFTAWIWFRSPSIETAAKYFLGLSTGAGSGITLNIEPVFYSLLGLFLVSDLHCKNKGFDLWIGEKSKVYRWLTYAFLIYAISTLSGAVQHPFIYFQF
jgi:D-alanyl-lipoteichoic acid acyltransferase DltB (MBOAT superfamily)